MVAESATGTAARRAGYLRPPWVPDESFQKVLAALSVIPNQVERGGVAMKILDAAPMRAGAIWKMRGEK